MECPAKEIYRDKIRLVVVWLWEQGPDCITPLTNVRELGVTELSYTIAVTVTRVKVYTKLKVTALYIHNRDL